MNALTSPAITELTTEDAPLNLIGEWLRQWFNGSLHAVGDQPPVYFPPVNLAFNQSEMVQPLYQFGVEADTTVRVVMIPRNEEAQALDTVLFSGKLATDRVLFNFNIASKHAGKAAAAQQAAQTVANLLKALLTNPDSRWALCAGGLTAFAPEPVRFIGGTDYAQRLVACSAQLQYAIRFGGQPLPPAGVVATVSTVAWPQRVEFFQPLALVAGEYLMGTFTARCGYALGGVTLVAFGPTTEPVTLQLEVDGALAGPVLVLPPALTPPNLELRVTADLTGVTLAPGQVARWKILRAPADGPASAWRAFVELSAVPRQ